MSSEVLLDDTSPQGKHETTEDERKLVNKVLKAVEDKAKSMQEKGLTTHNFVFGVANTIVVAWAFGALPQHFWIIYLAEVAFLFPLRWRNMIRARPREHLFWLDFCWFANFSAVIGVVLLATGQQIPMWAHVRLFSAAWAVGNGPLLMATGALNNALLFHDFDNTASVMIHLMPSLVMFCLGWHHQAVYTAWPNIFMPFDFNRLDPWNDIYANGAVMYAAWWIPYTMWLLSIGINMPNKGYDTIFHFTMRGSGGSVVYRLMGKSKSLKQAQENNGFTRGDALVYMVVHALLSYIAMLMSLVCFLNEWLHVSICGAMILSTIFHAANRYTFYILKSYGNVIRQSLGIPLNRRGSALGEAAFV